MNSTECPICSTAGAQQSGLPEGVNFAYDITCRKCGKFSLSGKVSADDIESRYGKRHIVSGTIRNRYEETGQKRVDLSKAVYLKELMESSRPPENPMDTIDHLLRYLQRKCEQPGAFFELNYDNESSILYARNEREFIYYIEGAGEMNYVEKGPGKTYSMTLKGWQRLQALQLSVKKSDQAFVAMSFDVSLTAIWDEGIKPALSALKYKPIRIDRQEHNEKICDKIIAEIRKSGLVVADFTLQKNGVYFEAGFALGLGIPVIWTCRKNDIDNLHFDTRQYNHILWESPEELRQKLSNRIMALYPSIDN